MPTTLEELLENAGDGERRSLDALVGHLRVRFLAIAKRRIGLPDAEDLVQEACLTIVEKFRQTDPESNLERWVFSVLRNKIGNYLQHRQTIRRADPELREHLAPRPDVDPAAGLHEKARLLRCFRKLVRHSPLYARAVNLIFQGYTSSEVCRRLHIASGYLYVALQRGRKSLADCMKREGNTL